jgi:hypothetical protein
LVETDAAFFQLVPPTFSIGATHLFSKTLNARGHLLVETDAGKAVVIRRLAGTLLGWPTDLEGGRASIFPIGATHFFNRCHPPISGFPQCEGAPFGEN